MRWEFLKNKKFWLFMIFAIIGQCLIIFAISDVMSEQNQWIKYVIMIIGSIISALSVAMIQAKK